MTNERKELSAPTGSVPFWRIVRFLFLWVVLLVLPWLFITAVFSPWGRYFFIATIFIGSGVWAWIFSKPNTVYPEKTQE